jgi:multiple sugar transport system substrate-binding protein
MKAGIRSLALLTLFCTALVILGCGGGEDDGKTVIRFRYWGSPEEVTIITGLLTEFEQANPGVKVKPERKAPDANSYQEVLLTEFAANNAPDVIFVVAEIKDSLSHNGLLENLNPYIEKDPTVAKSKFYQPIYERFSTDGKLLALPRDTAPFACVYYNKSMFDAAGMAYPKDSWDWDKFLEIAKKLRDPAKGIWGFADDWPIPHAFTLSSGGRHVDDYANPGKVLLDSPEAIRGLQFRYDLMFKHDVMPTAADNQAMKGGTMAMFMAQQLAMYYSGIWKTPEFRPIKEFDWDIAHFPKGPEGIRSYESGGSGYGIRKGFEHKDMAWKLIRFIAGPEAQAKIATTGLSQPSLKAIAESNVFIDGQKPLNKKFLLEAASIAVHPPASNTWLEFNTSVWGPMTDPLWVRGNKADVEAVVKAAVATGNKKFFSKK